MIASTSLTQIADIAIQAGTRIMEIYDSDFEVIQKADKSPVTEADRKGEELILDRLKAHFSDIPVVSEEAASEGHIPEFGDRFFLVDPLDGTKEFVNRNGEFTVNIALIEKGEPVAGVVYAPAKCLLYLGGKDFGAEEWQVDPHKPEDRGTKRRIETRPPPANGLVAIASRSHRDAKTEEFLNHYNVADIISAGSSLKFCVVARGDADIYPRHGRTMEWDTAAGHAVLIAAGGVVTELDGSPLTYGKKDRGLDNPYFVAKGRAEAR